VDSKMTTAEIARVVNGRLVGNGGVIIRGLAKIEDAGPEDLSFIANPRYVRFLETTRAGAVLVVPNLADANRTVIEVADPYLEFLRLLEMFHPRIQWLEPGIHPSSVVSPTAILGVDVSVGAFSYVGAGAVIGAGTRIFPQVVISAGVQVGERCEIHSHVSLREGVRLGARVVVQDGVVIGADGFGFAPEGDHYRKIPQLGIVSIGDDVEIGANTTVDRATLGETTIGAGTKLDNLIQVAHNAVVGSNTVIAAQTGISGSTRIGDNCRVGGQVGMIGHLRIGDRVNIGAQSGVGDDVPDGETVSGSPARQHGLWKRIEASLSRLPDLFKRVRRIEAAVFGDETKGKTES
jgi:UDP-3-O-[3-hydroxymyristoyl] glucosamine N-acyltransferase